MVPFSSGLVLDPIRIATIVPGGESGHLQSLINELDSTHKPRERNDYLPTWPGFGNVFRLRLSLAGGNCDVELDRSLDNELRRSSTPACNPSGQSGTGFTATSRCKE